MKKDADVGGFLSETFELVRDNAVWVAVFVAAITLFGVSNDWLALNAETVGDSNLGMFAGAVGLLNFVGIVVTVIAQYFLIAKMLESRGELLSPQTRIWAYIGLSILSGLAFILGFILLIVPGIILLVRWAPVSSFLIGGREEVMECFGKSWQATEGYGWQIFAAMLVIGIVGSVLVFGPVAGLVMWAEGGFSLVGSTISNLLANLLSAVFVAFGVAVYHLLTQNVDRTSEVFE